VITTSVQVAIQQLDTEAAGKVTPHQGGRADSVGVSSRALAAARDAGLTGFAAEGAGSGEAAPGGARE
jgi:hypothetical protein